MGDWRPIERVGERTLLMDNLTDGPEKKAYTGPRISSRGKGSEAVRLGEAGVDEAHRRCNSIGGFRAASLVF